MSQSVSDVLISAQSAELVVDNVTDNGRDRDIRSDLVSLVSLVSLVTQLTIPHTLRNLNHDIEGW